jgi:hypothetical protein
VRFTQWVSLVLLALIAAGGCAHLKPQLTAAELAERLQYGHDRTLEELVDIAMALGYEAADGEGHVRQVLELSNIGSGSINRQFFEVQLRGEGLYEVLFLENSGSVDQTNLSRLPRHLRTTIREFVEGLPEAKRSEYKPLLVRQQKLSRQMISYQSSDRDRAIEFTQKVISLERSNLYGLFQLPDGPFIFFGKESQKVFRDDFLEADERYNQLVQKFLGAFRPRLTL